MLRGTPGLIYIFLKSILLDWSPANKCSQQLWGCNMTWWYMSNLMVPFGFVDVVMVGDTTRKSYSDRLARNRLAPRLSPNNLGQRYEYRWKTITPSLLLLLLELWLHDSVMFLLIFRTFFLIWQRLAGECFSTSGQFCQGKITWSTASCVAAMVRPLFLPTAGML